jgi:gluconolactonase
MSRFVSLFSAVFIFSVSTVEAQTIIKLDPKLDAIVDANTNLEILLEGDGQFEGPTWMHGPGQGYLIFCDMPGNRIVKWEPSGKYSVVADRIFTGADSSAAFTIARGSQKLFLIGPASTTLDREGRIVFAGLGAGTLERIEADGKRTMLVASFEGHHLNAADDLVIKRDGAIYLTDILRGLYVSDQKPPEGVPHTGVYLFKDGNLTLLDGKLRGPNGIALTPDEKYLYVDDFFAKTVLRYEVKADDTVTNGQIFIDMNSDPAPGGPDGMKVDIMGNVYVTGPGGLWIISPDGVHLGTIKTPKPLTNLTFGDADGKTLYLTSSTALMRIRTKMEGVRP